MRASRILAAGTLTLGLAAAVHAQTPLSSTITYQGQLKQAGAPLTNTADFEFRLWDTAEGGGQVGATVTVTNVDVVNGLFTVTLDFGANAFAGDARWLEIAARSPTGIGSYTTLTPRHELTAAPYALYAKSGDTAKSADTVDGFHAAAAAAPNRLLPLDGAAKIPTMALYTGHGAGLDADRLDGQHGIFYQDATNLTAGTLPGGRLSGTYPNALTLSHTSNSFTGNGAALVNLNASNLASGTVADGRLSPNVALLSGPQTFSGTKTFQMPASFTAMVPFTVTTTANIANLNADLHDGYHVGNSAAQVPVSNGSICTSLNADLLDGYHAGNASGQIPISNSAVSVALNADKTDGSHVAASSVYTNSGTQYVANTGFCRIYATGTPNVLRIENPSGSGYTLRYYYSLDFAAPVFSSLAAGSTVDVIGLNNTTIDIRIYSGGGWLTYMGVSGGNGWLRGHVIYTD